MSNSTMRDLTHSMFMNNGDRIIIYIEKTYEDHDYDNIFKFIRELASGILIDNINEKLNDGWNKEVRDCYRSLIKYYNGEKLRYEERQNSKRSFTVVDA